MAIPSKCTKNKLEDVKLLGLGAESHIPTWPRQMIRRAQVWEALMDIHRWMDRINMASHGGLGDRASVLPLFFASHEVNEFTKSHPVFFRDLEVLL